MRLTPKFFGCSLSAIALATLVSCSNDLNQSLVQEDGLRLAKSPDITAWSGETFLTPASRSNVFPGADFITRAEGDEGSQEGETSFTPADTWDYDESKHEHADWKVLLETFPSEETIISQGAIDATNTDNKTGSVYYIPYGYEGSLDGVNFNDGDKLYNYGKVTGFNNVNFNGEKFYFYNAGEILYHVQSSHHEIVNIGDLTIDKYSNIDVIYNVNENGSLTLSGEPEYDWNSGYPPSITGYGSADIPDSMIIYSLTDVEMPDGGDFKAEADIHGELSSPKLLKIQNDKYQFLCAINSEIKLDITAGDLHASYITAPEITFDGAEVGLLPYGHIKANTIIMPNDAVFIRGAQGYAGLVEADEIYFQNTNNFISSFSDNVYMKINGAIDYSISTKFGGGGGHYVNKDAYIAAFPNETFKFNAKQSGTPECGEFWSLDGEDSSTQTPTDPDKCPNCPHGKHDGENCKDPNCKVPQCNPCPNIEDGEGGCEHSKAEHHWDSENNQWICDNDDCEAEDCQLPTPLEPEEKCDKCPHEKHEGENCKDPNCNIPECNPCPKTQGECGHAGSRHDKNGYCYDCDKDTEAGDDSCKHPATPNVPTGVTQTEVEVNLSINDEHVDKQGNNIGDLVAKLSIHVRLDGDVEVFIPIPKDYYVDNDDIVILNDHMKGNFIHGGPETVTYNVGGTDVTLTLSYEDDGIKVTTSGIDENVFEYCKTEFGDGINFEVWLYTNSRAGLDFDSFKDILCKSTVEFLDKDPDYYINAFNDTDDNQQGYKDCDVTMVEKHWNSYGESKTDMHLNGSEFNVIWKNKSCTGPEGEHDHDFLWKYMKKTGGSTEEDQE